jgi:two-component system KDP operon response regulator KdpE
MHPKILLVDDDSTLLKFLAEFLSEQSYQVITAGNGPEALRLAYHEQPNLAVLDVMMPSMDGWELCTRLHEMTDLPIILLTGKTSEADKLRGFRMGVDDYITKPFSFAELAARIQAVLNRAHLHSPAEVNSIPCGDLTIDLAKHEVRLAGKSLELTPTEYHLLEVLARSQGKAVAESDLTREVWGSLHSEETNAVRRYIWLLRQKIEKDPANPRMIVTVRGFGYRLDTGESGSVQEKL